MNRGTGARVGTGSGRALGWAMILVLMGCGGESDAAEESRVEPVQVSPENVTVAVRTEVRSGPAISGSLAAEREAVVRAEAAGSVVRVYAERGEPVRRGQLLARIEGAVAQNAWVSARSAVRAAEHQLGVARRDLERAEALLAAGAIAERDLEVARGGVAAAEAQYDAARAQLANARQQVANTEVRAPIAGIVSERPVDGGDVVAPGAALFTIVDPSSMRLEANVPADRLSEVRPGATVEFTVSGYPGRVFTGRVERVNPAADARTGQIPIVVSLPNAQGALVAGLFAQGRVASEAREAVVVPSQAVDPRGATPTVLRIRNGVVEPVPVRVGIEDPETERVEVLAGLAPGDTVLIGAALAISPGQPVRVRAPSAQR